MIRLHSLLLRSSSSLWLFVILATHTKAQRTIHTYYDSDDDNDYRLLQYWQQSWQAAGWKTVILNATHIPQQQQQQQQQQPSLNKWKAMSKTGGLYCHWDVFSLNSSDSSSMHESFPTKDTQQDTLTVYEVIAPTCMAGSTHAWQQMTQALYEHAQQETHYWTDALALVDLRDDSVLFQRRILQLDDALLFVESHDDPCPLVQKHLQRKHKWAVQFSAATLQRSKSLQWKYPEQRLLLARSWLHAYHTQCRFNHSS